VDGNKRIAWATTRAFSLVNGVGIQATTEVVEDLVVRLSDNKATECEVLAFFQRYGHPVDDALDDDRTA
jgi:prophage maintenance system killer protein